MCTRVSLAYEVRVSESMCVLVPLLCAFVVFSHIYWILVSYSGLWWWQLFPRMHVCSKSGMRAGGISVRIDKHFEIKCQAWMRMFGTNIYILHTLWWRKERQPAHNPRSFACVWTGMRIESGRLSLICMQHCALLYCVWQRENRCSCLAAVNACKTRIRFGVKKRFYFKLHFVRSLCATLMPIWDITSANKFRA